MKFGKKCKSGRSRGYNDSYGGDCGGDGGGGDGGDGGDGGGGDWNNFEITINNK